jgi:hypothetical protein
MAMSGLVSRQYTLRPFAGASAPAAVLGLSNSHNRPHGSITLFRGASLAKVQTRTETEISVREREAPKRGEITEFSERSRQRLRIKIAMVCREELPYFCTLTYPGEWIWDAKLWKRHLKIFSQRFQRRFPTGSFIWKLEFQERGAPHFHPFIWGIPEFEGLRAVIDFVSEAWFEVVGSGDEKHFRAGTSVERIRTVAGAIRYVSGYASKTDQTRPGQKVGRYWGVVAKQNIPWGVPETVVLDEQQSMMTLRTCRRFIIALNRQQRIRRVARQIGLKPDELISFGGWFHRERWQGHLGKHLRACGRRMPQKLRLRTLRSMNVLLDADFWAEKLPKLLSLTPPPHLSTKLSSAAEMLSSELGHSAADDSNPYTVKFKQRQGFAEFMTAVRSVFPNAVVVGKAGVNSASPEQLRVVLTDSSK